MSEDNGQVTSKGDGDNHRGTDGRFQPGHKYSIGNSGGRPAQKIRAALFKVVTPAAIKRAAQKLLEAAEEGDRQAFSELLDRTIGRPTQGDLLERIEVLEERMNPSTHEHA
jgi:hypothetical protein